MQFVLRHQTATLLVTAGTLVLTLVLAYYVPKGFFPVQDTGVILGVSDAPQTISFSAMAERQQALAAVILKDPDVVSLSSFIGVDGTNMTPNSGRIQINLKPREERTASASDIIRRLQPELATGRAESRCSCSPCRTSPWKTASAARSISIRSKTPTRRNSRSGRRGWSTS